MVQAGGGVLEEGAGVTVDPGVYAIAKRFRNAATISSAAECSKLG